MEHQLEEGYVAANSSNLPRVDVLMLGRFISQNKHAFTSLRFRNDELPQASYGQECVTYVQLKHNGTLHTLKCIIQSEDAATSRIFSVTLHVNEEKQCITSVQCHGCTNTQWTCKHALAFVMWLHRKSEEQTTETCYWTKRRLTTERSLKRELPDKGDQTQDTAKSAVMSQLIRKYDTTHDCNEFLRKIALTDLLINIVEEETRGQYQNRLWYELRVGRITASIAYEVYEMENDTMSNVETIMGRNNCEYNFAMKRGRYLKDKVRQTVCQKLGKEFEECGLFISKQHPVIAGSPDGICEDSIISIKCPTSQRSAKNYLRYGGPVDKYNTQIQILMYVTGKKMCYFCLANWDYEESNKVNIVCVDYDENYATEVVDMLVYYWKNNVYDLLCS